METEEWRRRNGDGGMVWSLASDRDLKVPVPRFSAHIEGSRNLIADQIFIHLREHFLFPWTESVVLVLRPLRLRELGKQGQ